MSLFGAFRQLCLILFEDSFFKTHSVHCCVKTSQAHTVTQMIVVNSDSNQPRESAELFVTLV